MSAKKPADTFERNLAELEAIVQQMEDGSLTLDASLNVFETGVKLIKQCQKTLTTAEQKIQIITENHLTDAKSKGDNKSTSTRPFGANEEQGNNP